MHTITRRIADSLFLILLLVIGFLCMRPSSYAAGLFFIPVSVAEWADDRNALPHFVAFFLLALIGFAFNLPARWLRTRRLLAIGDRLLGGKGSRSQREITANLLFLVSIVYLFELPQMWLPARTFSTMDLVAGWSGVTVALILFLLMRAFVNRFRPRYSILKA